MSWCITRNMSWDAVEAICREHRISFEELPVSGDNFRVELAEVSKKEILTEVEKSYE